MCFSSIWNTPPPYNSKGNEYGHGESWGCFHHFARINIPMICFRNQLVDPTVQRNLVFAALWSISWCFDPKTTTKDGGLIFVWLYTCIYNIYIYVFLFYRYIYMIIDMSICLLNMLGMFFLYVFSHFFFSGFLVPVQDMMMCSLGARDVFTSQAVDILTLTWPLADGQWFRCIELGEVFQHEWQW